MLSVNGKTLLLNDKRMAEDEHVKFVNECIKILKMKAGKQIILDLTGIHREPRIDENTGYIIPNAGNRGRIKIPMVEVVLRNGVNEEWRYYKRTGTDTKKFGSVVKYDPKTFLFDESKNFSGDSADLELLFFLVFVSPFCEKIPSIKSKQNPNIQNRPASYKVLMPEYEAQLAVEMGKKKATIDYKIFNELDFDQLKKLAKGPFQISGTDNMGENQLRRALSLIATSDNDNMEKFFRDMNVNPYVELQADVNEAIEKNIIKVTNQFGRLRWVYVKSDGKQGDDIINLAKGETQKQQIEALYEFYKTHPEDYTSLVRRIRPTVEKIKSEATD